MRNTRNSVVLTISMALLVLASGAPALAIQRSETGVCHIDDETGEVRYLAVPPMAVDAHLRHGDTPAPNGADDCFSPEPTVTPPATEVPPPTEPPVTEEPRPTQPPPVTEEPRPTETPPATEEPRPTETPPAGEAQDDEYTVPADGWLEVPAPGVLANDPGFTVVQILVEPEFGSLQFEVDGSFTYIADENFPGQDTFQYEAWNLDLDVSSTALVNLYAAIIDDTLLAVDDYYTFTGSPPFFVAAPGVLANDLIPSGSTVEVVSSFNLKDPLPVYNPDGSFTYIPESGVGTQDDFDVTISDGVSDSTSRVHLTLELPPDLPVAQSDFYMVPASGSFSVSAANGLLANDSSPLGSGLSATLYEGWGSAQITVNADGSFTISNAGNYNPGDSIGFYYQVTDSQGQAVLAHVGIQFT